MACVEQEQGAQPVGPCGIYWLGRKQVAEMVITRASVCVLKHAFAAHKVVRGTSLHTVQEVLGHASLKTTSIYVQPAQEALK